MLKKRYRISEKKDFERIYSAGQKIKGEYGMLIGLEEEKLANCKFGLVVSKKIGKAHQRNKFKRRVRYVIQKLLNEGFFEKRSFKITYIAFKNPETFESLEKELLEQFKKLFEK
jgi:ribonuclease P protein component